MPFLWGCILTNSKGFGLLVFVLILCFFVYWPGLYGDYVFDDSANILENSRIAIDKLDFESLRSAFWSGDSGPLGRPISMLSFAINYYFSGFDPFYFKLTNLVLHLLSVCFVFFLTKGILSVLGAEVSKGHALRPVLGAVLVAAFWGLHPLQLTSVLYVVQRMTSLSALFGFLALVIYVGWRGRPHKSIISSLAVLLSVVLALVFSVFSKESGVLFVLLLVWIELLVFRCREGGEVVRVGPLSLQQWLLSGCLLGGVVFLFFVLPGYIDPANFARRDFSLEERLMTESRVVFYYLRLLFFPSLSELSLYHDDFVISRGLLDPKSTLVSILGLFFVSLMCAILWRHSRVFAFSWGWFLISHSLESTFVSLELVHEHRNYFAIYGVFFLVAYFFSLARAKVLGAYGLALSIVVLLFAFVTWQRAQIWSNLVDHAAFEANSHPYSDRANYQMARVYMRLMQREDGDRYVEEAKRSLDAAAASYIPGNGSWFARLHLSYYLGEEPEVELISELENRLREKPFYNNNISFMRAFVDCQIDGYCKMPHHLAVRLLVAALDNPTGTSSIRAEVFKMLGNYYVGVAADFVKGEEFIKDALALKDDVNGRLLLAQIYRLQGEHSRAGEQLEIARILDRRGGWHRELSTETGSLSGMAGKPINGDDVHE